MSRKDIKVSFLKRSYDDQTHRSYEPEREYLLADNVAMRHVDAGNAEYVYEDGEPAQQSTPNPSPDPAPDPPRRKRAQAPPPEENK